MRNTPKILRLAAGAAICVSAAVASAWPGSPDLRAVQPAGVQRGIPAKLTFHGERLADSQGVLFYGPGISVTKVENADDRTVAVEITVDPDCPLGEHRFRLRTASGLSDIRTVFVGAMPDVGEVEPNSEMASAQRVPLNSTVSGVVTREDVDMFAVEVRSGERLSAEIEGMRLGRTLFDPAIAILDSRRFELAVSDDSPLLGQDGAASVVVPADGTYYIQVRESSYGGSDTSQYRLHIGSFPRPRAVSPPGGRPGEAAQLTWLGEPRPAPGAALTFSAGPRFQPVWAVDAGGLAPSPNWVAVSDLPVWTAPIEGTPAVDFATPIAFHGVLKATGQPGRHRFVAKGGAPLDVRVLARRLRTPVDAVLDVFDEKGAHLAGNDDSAGADPELRFTPPADGVYEARVREFRNRAGDDCVYRLEIEPPRPDLAVSLERVDIRRPQFLQAVSVPKGSRFAAMLRAERKDIGGEVVITAPALPEGVTMRTLPIQADLQAAPVLFEASPEAPLSGGLYELQASIGEHKGGFKQTVPLVLGPPNDTVYYQTDVDRIAIAVTQPAPFRVRLVQPAAPLLRTGGKTLKVVVERDAGFAADIAVQMLWNPPGVSSASSITVPAAQTEAEYAINASGDAPTKSWKLCVLARAPVQGGDVWISSDFVDLTVAETFATGAIQMAATQQGKPGALLCKLTPVRPFEGKAKLTLFGLPPKTRCEPREIAAADTEATFEVLTEPDAPVGQHRGLFCELEVVQAGETVRHRLAFDGVLRIDAPPPPPSAEVAVATPEPPPPAPTPTAAPPRPLSRLEQLRKDAAEGKKPGEAPK